MDDSNKLLRIFDRDNYFQDFSVEELISNGLNKWKGWSCSAGQNLLYIDYDGNVFVCNNASSKLDRFNHEGWAQEKKKLLEEGINLETKENIDNGLYKKYQRKFEKSGFGFKRVLDANDENSFKENPGFLGNIEQSFSIPTSPFTCPFECCGCGADIQIPKSKDPKKIFSDPLNFNGTPSNNAKKNPIGLLNRSPLSQIVLWDLGRRCNYDCSYCWPAVHNGKESHRDTKIILSTCDKIIKDFNPNKTKLFCFSGGEPTLHPHIITLLKFLKMKEQKVILTSNGSLNHEKWEKVIKYVDRLQMSAHFEFINEKRFVRNAQLMLENMLCTRGEKTLDIKLMTPPGGLERSLAMQDSIKQLPQWDIVSQIPEKYNILSLVPLRSLDDSEVLMGYSQEELEVFQRQ